MLAEFIEQYFPVYLERKCRAWWNYRNKCQTCTILHWPVEKELSVNSVLLKGVNKVDGFCIGCRPAY